MVRPNVRQCLTNFENIDEVDRQSCRILSKLLPIFYVRKPENDTIKWGKMQARHITVKRQEVEKSSKNV